MTEQYIKYKLKSTSNEARDFMAWNSIRSEERLRNSPHLRLQKKDEDGFFEDGVYYSKALLKRLK